MWKNIRALENDNKRLKNEKQYWVDKALELSKRLYQLEQSAAGGWNHTATGGWNHTAAGGGNHTAAGGWKLGRSLPTPRKPGEEPAQDIPSEARGEVQ